MAAYGGEASGNALLRPGAVIFVTVGTQMPFDRLVRAVDEWSEASGVRDIVAQVGPGSYVPRHFPTFPFLDPAEFARVQDDCTLIVAHAGIGSVVSAQRLGKPIIIMARDHTRGEHRNGHQIAAIEEFADRPGVYVAADERAVMALLDRRETLQGGPIDDGRAPIEMVAELAAYLAAPPKVSAWRRVVRLVKG